MVGFFRRLRASSGARKLDPAEDPANAPAATSNGSAIKVKNAYRPYRDGDLNVPNNTNGDPSGSQGFMAPPRRSMSSATTSTSPSPISSRGSRMPWKRDKKQQSQPPLEDFHAIPYESTEATIKGTPSGHARPAPPPSKSRNASVPSFVTSSPSPPPRPPAQYNNYNNRTPAYIPTANPSSPSPPSAAAARAADRHARTASHASQATVISLSSTFTGHSSISEEWEREGGPLGKLPFESDDWGGLTPSLDRSTPASKRATPSGSPTKQGGVPSALSMSPTPKRPQPQGMRKLGTVAMPTPSPRVLPTPPPRPPSPSVPISTGDIVSSPIEMPTPNPMPPPAPKPKGKDKKGKGSKPEAKTSQDTNQNDTAKDHEEVEEIRTSEADDEARRRFWKPGMRSRRPSRSSRTEDRPVSMSQIEARPQLRRPSSSLFHNPFGRTQSRVSLAFDLEAQNPAPAPATGDDGSFQLKSFRHISGASDAEAGGFQQYLSLVTKNDTGPQRESQGQDRSTSNGTIKPDKMASPIAPTSPTLGAPRPRPPSAAGSESSLRLSVAAFRKGVRRSSSTMLADEDDDDIPLSLSRGNIGDMRRDSSALSLTDQGSTTVSPHAAKRGLPRAPEDSASRPISSISTGSIGLGSPPARSPRSPTTTSSGLAFIVKGPRPSPRQVRNAAEAEPSTTSLAAPPEPPVVASPKVMRPPRKSSLRNIAGALKSSPNLNEPDMPRLPEIPTTFEARSASLSPPPPAANPLKLPEPQATLDDLSNIKLPPRPDELPDEQPLRPAPAPRGGTLSPSFSIEPLRRISGFWGGNEEHDDDDDGKEEAFDPMAVEATMKESPDTHASPVRLRPQTTGEGYGFPEINRQSLYDRLTAATTSISNALPTGSSEDKLHIPPPRTPSPPPINEPQHSPSSERTASPVRMPPVMSAPPAPPPMVPHSSFGRVPRRAAEKPGAGRAGKDGWASSSDEEDAKPKQQPAKPEPPARAPELPAPKQQPLKPEQPIKAAESPAPAPAPPAPPAPPTLIHPKPILQRPSQNPLPKASADSDSEDEPLQAFVRKHSRPDLQQMRTSSSRTSFKTRAELETARVTPQPTSRPTSQLKTRTSAYGNLRNSASNWSLSSSPDSPDSEELAPPVRPRSRASSHNSARPSSRILQRPASRISLARNSSSDQLRTMGHTASSERLRNLPHSQSNDRLRPLGDRRHHGVMDRPSASPASSQSGLTGDSSTQQPMTPRSTAEVQRRSWATEGSRPRADMETASTRQRPSTHFDQMSSAGSVAGSINYPGGDGYAQPAYKQQFQAQWMAAAQRHFEDMWERASSVSNAQTLPNSHDMFQPTYGYSYSQPPPMPPMPMAQMPPQMPHMFGGYPQYPQGYGGYGPPQVAFPGMGMPGMPMQGMHGMPPGMPPMGGGGGGGMFSYGPGAQSVYGGEFGPPVAPGMREGAGSGSAPGSPSRRQRGSSGTSARPASVAAPNLPSSSASVVGVPASHYAAQRNTPPRRMGARRGSTLALSEAGGPPTAWRQSTGDDMETPRPRRVANAS